jgi:hypothetical protein
MAEIVNLRQARKRKRRSEAGKEAAENRVAHGQPAVETAKARRLLQLEERRLEAHRLGRKQPD